MRVEDIDDVTVLASEASMRGCVMQLTCLSRSAFFQVLQNVFLCTHRGGRGDICECCLYVLVLSYIFDCVPGMTGENREGKNI